MIFLHETFEIAGGRMAEFTQLHAEWRRMIARDGGARVLWLWEHTHGTGPSYQAIAISAVADWQAWGRLVDRRRATGDLGRWDRRAAALLHETTSKILLPTSWSPLQTVDLGSSDLLPHGDSLFLHDTGWPFPGKLDDYVEALGTIFFPQTKRSQMISVEACWTTCPGTGRSREVVLLQRILSWEPFSRLLTTGERPARAGDWMEAGLRYRDRWESKLLRPA